MDFSSERAMEAAEAVTNAITAHSISAIKAGLAVQGADECVGCGEDIPEARRKALPSARRCVDCQSAVEGAR